MVQDHSDTLCPVTARSIVSGQRIAFLDTSVHHQTEDLSYASLVVMNVWPVN